MPGAGPIKKPRPWKDAKEDRGLLERRQGRVQEAETEGAWSVLAYRAVSVRVTIAVVNT